MVHLQRTTLHKLKKTFTIQFKNHEFEASEGSNLRKVLLKNNVSPHNGNARYLNCKGLGTCGTCAVEITGETNSKTNLEKLRLNFPPHKTKNGLRLACQIKVCSSLKLIKHDGFWGEKISFE